MRQPEDDTENVSSSANEPLIASQNPSQQPDTSLVSSQSSTLASASPIIRFLTLSAGISGLLFGFDTGVISSTLVSIGTDLSNRPLTVPDKTLVTAITSLFALLSAPTTGFFADKYGRRSVIFVPAVLFVVGAVTQALAGQVWTMAAGRALVGVAVGVASGAVPLYITELAPAELRGRLVTVQSLFITGGQVVAYLIGWIFASWPGGWRWMVGLGAVPAVLQLGLLFGMPETPRFLVQNGEPERAEAVLKKVYAGLSEYERDLAVRSVLQAVRAEIEAEGKGSDKRTMIAKAKELTEVPGNRRALTIACMLQGLQQLCGFVSGISFDYVCYFTDNP
jgi:SP family myo-inositol transporter-like MFS transporter 13